MTANGSERHGGQMMRDAIGIAVTQRNRLSAAEAHAEIDRRLCIAISISAAIDRMAC